MAMVEGRTGRIGRETSAQGRLLAPRPWLLATTVLSGVVLQPAIEARANPQGGTVAGGSATISSAPGLTTIDQSSQRAVINWQNFSIGHGETTRFNQPNTDAIALNRVTGRERSDVFGKLQANGNIWLINPNGVLIGPSAQIDVNGFLATTSDILDADFMAGRNQFSIPSPQPQAAVVNQGRISIGETGLGALVAPHVRNDGVIVGRMSQVVLAGAPTFTVDFHGDGLIHFEVTSDVAERVGSQGALVENTGLIGNEGGRVLLTASAAAGVVDDVINTEGVIEARSVAARDGVIILAGGDHGGVRVAGTIDASASETGGAGGRVSVLGERVDLADGSRIDVSGESGGGEVLVGGNYKGLGPEANAKQTRLAKGAAITADARREGNGGRVIVWGDDVVAVSGSISAHGGSMGGDGGFVETSARGVLSVDGTISTAAPSGRHGTWLIDPQAVVIAAAGGAVPPLFQSTPPLNGVSQVSAATLSQATSNVIIQAVQDITVTAPVSMANAGVGLVLQAGRDIRVEQPIKTRAGGVHLEADSPHVGSGSDGVGMIAVNAPIETQGANGAAGAATLIGASFLITSDINSGAAGTALAPSIANAELVIGRNANGQGQDFTVSAQELFRLGGGALASRNDLQIGEALTAGPAGNGTAALSRRAGSIRIQEDLDVGGAGGGRSIAFHAENTVRVAADVRDPTRTSAFAFNANAVSIDPGAVIEGREVRLQTRDFAIAGDVRADVIALGRQGHPLTIGGPGQISDDELPRLRSSRELGLIGSQITLEHAIDRANVDIRMLATDVAQRADARIVANSLSIQRDNAGGGSGLVSLPAGNDIRELAIGAVAPQRPFSDVRVNNVSDLAIGVGHGVFGGQIDGITAAGDVILAAGGSILQRAVIRADGIVDLAAAEQIAVGADIRSRSFALFEADTLAQGSATIEAPQVAIFARQISQSGGGVSSSGLTLLSQQVERQPAGSANLSGANRVSVLAAPADPFAGGSSPFNSLAFNNTKDLEVGATTVPLNGTLISFNGIGADAVDLRVAGRLTLAHPVASTGTAPGTNIVVRAQSLTNKAGPGGLHPGPGRFLAYSENADPLDDVLGGLAGQRRYNASFERTPPSSLPPGGDFFLYAIAPSLTLTAQGEGREYGDANVLSLGVAGLIAGDTLDAAVLRIPNVITTARADSAVGTYPVTFDSPPIASELGYTLVAKAGSLDIRPAPLGIVVGSLVRTYGDGAASGQAPMPAISVSPDPRLGFRVPGEDIGLFRNARLVIDDLGGDANAGNPSDGYLRLNARPGEPYAVRFVADPLTNYVVNTGFPSGVPVPGPGSLTVQRRDVSISVPDTARIYGESITPRAVISGYVFGEDRAVVPDPDSVILAEVSFADSEVISKFFKPADPSVPARPDQPFALRVDYMNGEAERRPPGSLNYQVSNEPAIGTLRVDRAQLVLVADDKIKPAGAPNPALTVTPRGLRNGDALANVAEFLVATTAAGDSPIGTYPIKLDGIRLLPVIFAAGETSEAFLNYSVSTQFGTLQVVGEALPGPVSADTDVGVLQPVVAKQREDVAAFSAPPAAAQLADPPRQVITPPALPTPGRRASLSTLFANDGNRDLWTP